MQQECSSLSFNTPTGLLLLMELREPKRKCRVRVSLQQPFPVPTDKALWQVYTGKYSGDFVVVEAPDEMIALHNMVIWLYVVKLVVTEVGNQPTAWSRVLFDKPIVLQLIKSFPHFMEPKHSLLSLQEPTTCLS